jgi:hypothetical protein
MSRATIDVKSLLVGLLLGLGVILAAGAADRAGPHRLEPVGVVLDTTTGPPHTPVVYMIDPDTKVVYSQRPHGQMEQVMQFGAK